MSNFSKAVHLPDYRCPLLIKVGHCIDQMRAGSVRARKLVADKLLGLFFAPPSNSRDSTARRCKVLMSAASVWSLDADG